MGESRTSILAIHPGALGDVILLGHLLAALGEPARAITFVAGGEKARLLAEAGVVGSAMDYNSLPMDELFSDVPLESCRLGAMLGRCDRIVECFVEADSAAARRLRRICGAVELASLPVRPPTDFDGHLTALWRQQLGLGESMLPAKWTVPPSWRSDAAGALAGLGVGSGRRYVAIHPGAGSAGKCWPTERFLALATKLRSAGVEVVFVLGPVELDLWSSERISRLGQAGAILAGAPLTRLAGALAGAVGFVGNDSGVGHLAAAVDVPTVALFGPTSPRHFSPLGRRVRCVRGGTMGDISVGRVAEALGALCGT